MRTRGTALKCLRIPASLTDSQLDMQLVALMTVRRKTPQVRRKIKMLHGSLRQPRASAKLQLRRPPTSGYTQTMTPDQLEKKTPPPAALFRPRPPRTPPEVETQGTRRAHSPNSSSTTSSPPPASMKKIAGDGPPQAVPQNPTRPPPVGFPPCK